MTFQKQVETSLALGIPGAYASVNPIVSAAIGYLADGNVEIGSFVWPGADEGTVTNKGKSGVKPLGFVVLERTYPIMTAGVEAQNYVPDRMNVPVQAKGDFFAVANTVAEVGQKVFASITTGEIATDDEGETLAGYVETDYKVVTAADAGGTFVISNW